MTPWACPGEWLRDCETELRAAGLHPPRGRGRQALELNQREREVAVLVARGLTNREAAAELFVSTKTVEYHLGNIFAKLGITSRRQLRGAFTDTAA